MKVTPSDDRFYSAEDLFWDTMSYTYLRGEAIISLFGSTWSVIDERQFSTLEKCDDFVQEAKVKTLRIFPKERDKGLFVRPVKTKFRREPITRAYYRDSGIYIPDLESFRREGVLIHELAHHGSRGSHTEEFVDTYLTILEAVRGREARDLFSIFLLEKGITPKWIATKNS